MDDDPQPPTVAQYRKRSERARARARARHRDRLTDVLNRRGVDDADAVAEIVLDALTEWRHIDSGVRCTCSCHPQLPDSDHHDYGFACICARILEPRRRSFPQAINEICDLWQSPDSEQARYASQAAETALQDWLTEHPGVAVHSHGGSMPEQWRGDVDGHSFYFRERHDDWHIEIDLRPTGQIVEVLDGHTIDGRTRTRKQALQQGDVIATGTIDAADYGATAVERAQFIVTTIRDHLKRTSCTHHADKQDAITAAIGTSVDWCPTCGIRLPAR